MPVAQSDDRVGDAAEQLLEHVQFDPAVAIESVDEKKVCSGKH